MAGVGAMDLARAVQAVALIVDAAQAGVIGLDGRQAYPFESTCALVTVSVHLADANAVDQAAALLGLSEEPRLSDQGLYSRAGDWAHRVHVSIYGPSPAAPGVAGVAS